MRAVRQLRSSEPLAYRAKLLGLLTMEDCLEALLQGEIFDETDPAGDDGLQSPGGAGGVTRGRVAAGSIGSLHLGGTGSTGGGGGGRAER